MIQIATFPALVVQAIEDCEGWCDEEKALELFRLVTTYRPEVIVEIGVFGGASLIPLALGCKFNNFGMVLGIDAWSSAVAVKDLKEETPLHGPWWKEVNLEKIRNDFFNMLAKYAVGPFVTITQADSDLVTPPKKIDLLHVDGCHDEVAVRDMQRFGTNVVIGGFVVVDDLDWVTGYPQKGMEWLLENGFVEERKLGTGAVLRRIQ